MDGWVSERLGTERNGRARDTCVLQCDMWHMVLGETIKGYVFDDGRSEFAAAPAASWSF